MTIILILTAIIMIGMLIKDKNSSNSDRTCNTNLVVTAQQRVSPELPGNATEVNKEPLSRNPHFADE